MTNTIKQDNKSVDSNLYDEKYFLTGCSGFNEYKKCCEGILEPRLEMALKLADVKKGFFCLDFGCGRGEILVNVAKRGANIVGMDYSKSAIKLSKTLIKKFPVEVRNRIELREISNIEIPFNNKVFDRIFLLDVVEHLYPNELNLLLKKLNRVLKKDGVLIIHTCPNKFFLDFIYKYWHRPLKISLKKIEGFKNYNLPKEPRDEYQKKMHINEQTFWEIKRYLNKNNFDCKFIPDLSEVGNVSYKRCGILKILVKIYSILYYFPLNIIFSNHIWVVASKK